MIIEYIKKYGRLGPQDNVDTKLRAFKSTLKKRQCLTLYMIIPATVLRSGMMTRHTQPLQLKCPPFYLYTSVHIVVWHMWVTSEGRLVQTAVRYWPRYKKLRGLSSKSLRKNNKYRRCKHKHLVEGSAFRGSSPRACVSISVVARAQGHFDTDGVNQPCYLSLTWQCRVTTGSLHCVNGL